MGDDNQERLDAFNMLRNNRGLKSITKVNELNHVNGLYNEIDYEWIRETYGEGQLFFWYKRNNCTGMRSATDQYGTSSVTVSANKYVWPIPDGETKYN